MSFQHVDEMTVAGMVYRIETQCGDGERVRIAMTAYRESDPDRTPIHGILHVPLAEVPALRLVVGRCLQALMSETAPAVADSLGPAAASPAPASARLADKPSDARSAGSLPRARTEVALGGAAEEARSAPATRPAGGVGAADQPRAPRARLPWRPEQEQEIVRRFDQGDPIGQIAAGVGRTEGAVRSRLRLLGRDPAMPPQLRLVRGGARQATVPAARTGARRRRGAPAPIPPELPEERAAADSS